MAIEEQYLGERLEKGVLEWDMLFLEYDSFNFHAKLETSILSTREIVPIDGMDAILLVVVVEVTNNSCVMDEAEITLLVRRLLILLPPFLPLI